MRVVLLIAALVATSVPTFGHEPRVVSPGSTDMIPFPGHKIHLLSGPGDTPSTTAILELELAAKTFGAPPHLLPR